MSILGDLITGDGPSGSSVTATAEKALILNSKYIDLATLTASTEVNNLPVTFLQNRKPNKVWRSTSIVDQYILVSFDRPVAVNCAAVVNPNFDLVRLQGASSLAGLESPSVDSGFLSLWPESGKPVDEDHEIFTGLAQFENDAAYQYWRIYVAGLAEVDSTYFQAGRLILDHAFRFTRGIDTGFGLQIETKDDQFVTDFNSLFTSERGDNSRNYVFPVSAVAYNDVKDYLYGLFRYCGKSKDFIFCADPGATNDIHLKTVHAVFADMPSMKLQTVWHGSKRTWNLSLPLREVT